MEQCKLTVLEQVRDIVGTQLNGTYYMSEVLQLDSTGRITNPEAVRFVPAKPLTLDDITIDGNIDHG